jgi:hypothetical protein
MTVKKLISLLQKMPQNLQVGVSAHDNSEWEVSGWPQTVWLFDKDETECPDFVHPRDRECYDSLPRKTVVICC